MINTRDGTPSVENFDETTIVEYSERHSRCIICNWVLKKFKIIGLFGVQRFFVFFEWMNMIIGGKRYSMHSTLHVVCNYLLFIQVNKNVRMNQRCLTCLKCLYECGKKNWHILNIPHTRIYYVRCIQRNKIMPNTKNWRKRWPNRYQAIQKHNDWKSMRKREERWLKMCYIYTNG